MFLKVSPTKGVMRFRKQGKLSPRYVRTFEILDRIGQVAYRLALPPQLANAHNMFHTFMSPCSKSMNRILLTSYHMSQLCSKRIWPFRRKWLRFLIERNRCSEKKWFHSSKYSGSIINQRRLLWNEKRIFRRSTHIHSCEVCFLFGFPVKFGGPNFV